MEVISSAVPLPSRTSQTPRRSLLARRSARKPIPIISNADEELHIPPSPFATMTTTAHQAPSLPSVINLTLTPPTPIVSTSSATIASSSLVSSSSSAISVLRGPVPRKSFSYPDPSAPGWFLPGVPLTPITASPSLTPEPRPGSGMDVGVSGIQSSEDREDDYMGVMNIANNVENEVDGVPVSGLSLSVGDNEVNTIPNISDHENHVARDIELGRGHESTGLPSLLDTQDQKCTIPNHVQALSPPSPTSVSLQPPVNSKSATPMWTSTPPTPPQITEFLRDTALPTHGHRDAALAAVSGSHVGSGFGKRRVRPRPASVAIFPPQPSSSTKPSPESYSVTRSRTASHRCTTSSMQRDAKRPRSLPPHFGKPLPPVPPSATPSLSSSVSPSRTSDSSRCSRTPSLSSSRSAGSLRSRSRTRRGLDLMRSRGEEVVILTPSLSRHPGGHITRAASPLSSGVRVEELQEVKSEGGHAPPMDTSDSMASFKTARSSFSPPTSPTRSSAKKMFHLEGSVSEGEEVEEIVRRCPVEKGVAASADEAKTSKRFHALMELLKTEVGYLMDLRALVTIYLAQLPNLSVPVPPHTLTRPSPSLSISTLGLARSFPSSRSSFISISQASGAPSGLGPPHVVPDIRLSAHTRLEADASQENGKLHPETGKGARKARDDRRSLLSDGDVQRICRNAEELLKLHEGFVAELKNAVEPLGYGAAFARLNDILPAGEEPKVDYQAELETVDEAVNAISDVFIRQSPSFSLYELFCPKQNEAADMIRNVQDQYPTEWDAFEQRCSLLVAHAFELSSQRPRRRSKESSKSSGDSIPPTPESLKSKRRHSTPTLTFVAPSFLASDPTLEITPTESDLGATRKRKRSGDHGPLPPFPSEAPSQVGRLKFADYLIKPVQRICKYPLLLDQLKSVQDANSRIENACNAMRSVVGLVDHASMKQAHSVKSALIVSRIALSLSLQSPRSTSPPSPVTSGTQEEKQPHLSSDFLSTLGACLLSGALDIVQYPSLRARYLGSFLYVGGYMVLVKITKGGKVYEPKYWFSLLGFELVDDEDDDAAFPYSFHLCGHGHHLQFAAACQLEKEIWMAAIQDAMSKDPEWKNEPQSNLQDTIPAVSPAEEGQHEFTATPLPTIQSLSELENNDAAVPPLAFKARSRSYKTMPRMDGSALRQDCQASNLALSRRSSTASVKAFFAPLSFDSSTRITRPSLQVRQQVDHALHDVFSDNCLTVRSQAQMREEELFQVRRKLNAGMSRSNSGLSLTTAMKRRYDSVLVSTKRKGFVDSHAAEVVSDSENGKTAPIMISRRAKGISGKRRHRHSLSVVPSEVFVLPEGEGDGPLLNPDALPDSPSPLSNCSSATSSNIGSTVPSPLDGSIPLPLPTLGSTRTNDYRPKRTRSMVDNVRYFFHSRSVSPTPSSTGHLSPGPTVSVLEAESESPGGLVQWWRKGSLRRRSQSSPDVPSDDSPCATSGHSSEDNHGAAPVQDLPQERPFDNHETDENRPPHSLPPTPRRVAFKDSIPSHSRRRSLHVSPGPEVKTPVHSDSVPNTPRKTLKSVLFLRSSSFTPLDSNR